MPNRSEQFDENYSKTQEKIQQAKSLDLKKRELDKLAEYEKLEKQLNLSISC